MRRVSRANTQSGVSITGLLAVMGLLFTACSSAPVSDPDSSSGMTPLEAHTRGQEAIAACMKKDGFDYTPIVFIETADRGGIHNYEIDEPELLGYGALLLAVSDSLYLMRLEPAIASGNDIVAYQEALYGPHQDEGEGDYVAQGCITEAGKAVPEIRIVEEATDDGKAHWGPITEFGTYLEYGDAWQACLKAEGYERLESSEEPPFVSGQRAAGPIGAKATYFYSHLQEFDEAIDESGATIDLSVSHISIESVLQIVYGDPELSRLLDDEIREATVDAECRDALSSRYFDDYDDLINQIEGE